MASQIKCRYPDDVASRHTRIRSLIGAIAALGVVGAHSLAYVLASRDAHDRGALLSATGHARWSLVVALAVGLSVAGFARFVTSRMWVDQAAPAHRFSNTYRYALPRLAALQVVAFLCLEVAERTFVSRSIADLLTQPALLIGMALQVAGALLGALLLVLVVRVVAMLRRSRRRTRPSTASFPSYRQSFFPRFQVATGAGTLRGPPATPAHA